MIEHIAIGAVLGALFLTVLYLFTRPYHEEKKDDFISWKQKVLYLENWKEAQEASAKFIVEQLKQHKTQQNKFESLVKMYETSAAQVHEDYVLMNAHLVGVERRYADLVPVHRHYHLSDDAIKIKRVTNERDGRTETKMQGTGVIDPRADFEKSQAQQFSTENARRPETDREARIPSYSPPGPGHFGTGKPG